MDLTQLHWKVTYSDGKTEEDPKKYPELKRNKIEKFELIDSKNKSYIEIKKPKKLFVRLRTRWKPFKKPPEMERVWIVGSNGKCFILSEDGKVTEEKVDVNLRDDEK